MSNARRKLLLNALKLSDLTLMILAFMVAALAVLHQSRTLTITEFFSMRVKIQSFAIFSLLVFAWHLIFSLSGLYASRRLSNRRGEVVDVINVTSLGTFVMLLGAIVFHIKLVTAVFLAVFWLVSTCTTVVSRLLLRVILTAVRKRGRKLRDMVVVGTSGAV